MADEQANLDEVVASLRAEAPSSGKGRLKIFFGYAAGVGKTYDMLLAARAQKKAGVDVVVGYVEPHGRPETEALLEGLEVLPLRTVEHRGIDAQGVRPRRGPPPQARPGARRRTGPHQRARLAARQAVAGRGRTAGRRHQRLHDAQRPAPRDPQRRHRPDHRRGRARDGARRRLRPGRRGPGHRPAARRTAGAVCRRQGLRARPGPAGHAELLPEGQPHRPARAGPAPDGRPRPRRGPDRRAGPRPAPALVGPGAAAGVRQPQPDVGPRHPGHAAAGDRPPGRLGGRLRRNAGRRGPVRDRPRRTSCGTCAWPSNSAPRRSS